MLQNIQRNQMQSRQLDFTIGELINILSMFKPEMTLYVNGGEWQNNPYAYYKNGRLFLHFTDDKSQRINTVEEMIERLESYNTEVVIYIPIVTEEIADSHNFDECEFKHLTTVTAMYDYVVLN